MPSTQTMRTIQEAQTTPSVDLPIRWRDMVLPVEVADLFQHAKSLRFPGNREEVLSLAMGSQGGGTFEASTKFRAAARWLKRRSPSVATALLSITQNSESPTSQA